MNISTVCKKIQTSLIINLLLILVSCNSYLFYQAPRYNQDTIDQIESNPQVIKISYEMPFGKQTSLYLTPRLNPEKVPDRLWILFGGINAPAFGWYEWFKTIPDDRTGLFLIEYPGYGLCEGVPREERILESSIEAFNALAEYFDIPLELLEKNLGLLGHSLGSLTMLQFAPHVNAQKVLLISPMTTLSDQVKKMYGGFKGSMLNVINPEKYNNRARLKELLELTNHQEITIIHGTEDDLIPVTMGRELADLSPKRIKYYEIPWQGHPGLIAQELDLIYKIMFDQ